MKSAHEKIKFMLGRKVGMTQILVDQKIIPVTVVEAGPLTVTQVKTVEKDGYQGVQFGFGNKKHINKAQLGHFKDLGKFAYLREVSLDENTTLEGLEEMTVGKTLDASIFKNNDLVKVTGISKGRGFQGVVKRHGFKGIRKTHGTKHGWRAPGSIGSTDAQHVFKGRKMAGRMGADKVSVKNLKVVKIEPEENLLYIKGAIPGTKDRLVCILGSNLAK
ncbi:MAG TPA: 50S ribosomal protein L3 [Candidatus Paceibacterota bacterium]|nr:50S ribosomal protein L3 [Candidatus Paceibacterota bacterium]